MSWKESQQHDGSDRVRSTNWMAVKFGSTGQVPSTDSLVEFGLGTRNLVKMSMLKAFFGLPRR